MPIRKAQHLVGFAGLNHVSFKCPDCGADSTYHADLLEPTVQCRNCRRRHPALIFECFNSRCISCNKQVKEPVLVDNYHGSYWKLCQDCAEIFDERFSVWLRVSAQQALAETKERPLALVRGEKHGASHTVGTSV